MNKCEELPFSLETILEAIWRHSRMWNAILESESELGTLPSFSLRPLWGPCEAYPELVGFVVATFFHVFFFCFVFEDLCGPTVESLKPSRRSRGCNSGSLGRPLEPILDTCQALWELFYVRAGYAVRIPTNFSRNDVQATSFDQGRVGACNGAKRGSQYG